MSARRFSGFSRLATAELALCVQLDLHTLDHGVNRCFLTEWPESGPAVLI